MNILQKVTGKSHVPKDLLLLLSIGGLYFLSIALSNTFVNVYLWKQSQSFFDIGLYNLMIVIFQPLTFILGGRFAKRIDRVIVLRLGVISLAIFFITVLLLGSHTSQFLLFLGALIGIGFGFYWLAFNVLTFEITEPETRDFFNSFLGLLSSFAGMIGPITAGWIISSMEKFTGYKVIFALSLFLFTLAVVTSFFLKRRPSDGDFTFKRIIIERKHNKHWKAILNAHFFQGLREGTFLFVIVIWVYVTTKSEMALGTFGLVESAVMFLSYLLVSRIIKPSGRKKAILIGGILLYAGIYLITFQLTFTNLIYYAILTAIAYPILVVPYVSMTYDVIGSGWKAAEMRIEYIVVKELFYNAGRIISIMLFLTSITLFEQKDGIRFLLLILGLGHLAIYFCIRHINLIKKESQQIKPRPPDRFPDGESGSPI